MRFGIHCSGCGVNKYETIAQGAAAHGLRAEPIVAALSQARLSGRVPTINNDDLVPHRRAPGEFARRARFAHVIPVMSGKGGVGKSLVTGLLAVGLRRAGKRVGILDADITGPSIPRLFGLTTPLGIESDPNTPAGTQPRPLMTPAVTRSAIEVVSANLLTDKEDTAMIWRGPMVMGALDQMMGQVSWGPLDIMVVDMPPGTGDAQLTMAQRVALTGAVIVSTPQDIALLDARRGVRMFERVQVPVLGLVENMSFYCCPNCGHRADLFGHGGARLEAARLGTAFLGEVPLLLDIRTASDAGTPIVAAAPDSEAAKAFGAIASAVWAKVSGAAVTQRSGPRIVVE